MVCINYIPFLLLLALDNGLDSGDYNNSVSDVIGYENDENIQDYEDNEDNDDDFDNVVNDDEVDDNEVDDSDDDDDDGDDDDDDDDGDDDDDDDDGGDGGGGDVWKAVVDKNEVHLPSYQAHCISVNPIHQSTTHLLTWPRK